MKGIGLQEKVSVYGKCLAASASHTAAFGAKIKGFGD